MESIRHGVAESFGVVSCLEVGPRYLHSTGQLQKGGPNCGVFLILSADELKDIPLPREAESLGALAKAQASGDLITLADRGRRCLHLHLPDNSGETVRMLAQVVNETIAEIMADRAIAEEAELAEEQALVGDAEAVVGAAVAGAATAADVEVLEVPAEGEAATRAMEAREAAPAEVPAAATSAAEGEGGLDA